MSQAIAKDTLGPIALRSFNLKPAQIRNIQQRFAIGHNLAVDNVNLQDVTTFGEDYITVPTVLTAMQVSSNSIQDDNGGGTGAKRVMIHGLDENWHQKTQFVLLDGTAPVTLDEDTNTIEFLRVDLLHVTEPSPTNSQHTAVGIITLEDSGGGTVYGRIDAGGNMELATRITVPAGFSAYVSEWDCSVGNLPNTGDEVIILLRGTCDPVLRTILNNVFIFQDVVHLKEGSQHITFDPPFVFPEKSEVKVSAKLNGGNGTTVVSAAFRYFLVPNQ